MKFLKGILTAYGLIALLTFLNASSKEDRIEQEIIELKRQINEIEKRRSLEDLNISQAGEGKVNEWLTISGYIEMSFLHYEYDEDSDDYGEGYEFASSSEGDIDEDSMSVGIVDIDFSFDFSDNFKAFIDITADGSALDMYVQEAWGHYMFGESGFSIKFGRQDVALGLEANEAVNLYQFSVAYFNELGLTPGYAQGLSFYYEIDKVALRAGVYDGLWDDANGGGADDLAFILSATFTFGEKAVAEVSYSHEDEEDGDEEHDLFNVWFTYNIGEKFEIGAEYSYYEFDDGGDDTEIDHYILRGTWKINEKVSLTVRYDRTEDDDSDSEVDTFIISPFWTINDHLGVLAEVGVRDGESGSSDFDEEWFAFEAFITF